jgi:hypothetical protein
LVARLSALTSTLLKKSKSDFLSESPARVEP